MFYRILEQKGILDVSQSYLCILQTEKLRFIWALAFLLSLSLHRPPQHVFTQDTSESWAESLLTENTVNLA